MEQPLFKLCLCLTSGVSSHGEGLEENRPVSELNPFITVFPRSLLLGGILEFLQEEELLKKLLVVLFKSS